MQACKFTITTAVDGEISTVVKSGRMNILDDRFILYYQEEGANVCIVLQKNEAVIDRQGDYLLHLPLQQGEMSVGSIGLGGSDGKISIQTHSVKYSQDRNLFKLSLRYDLIFSEEERQKMRLNLRATLK